MAYRKSVARNEFEIRVQNLKATARKASLKKNSVPSDIVDLVYHAAIFECSAGIEEYIKNNLESWFYQLRSQNKKMSNIPERIRKVVFLNESKPIFDKYITGNSVKDAVAKLDFDSKQFECHIDRKKVNSAIQAKTIYSGKKYPSVKNIKNLFYRIGIDNVFDELSRLTRRDTESLVESFNDVRTAIAHQSPPRMTYEDVKRHLDNIVLIVQKIDRLIYRHVVSSSGDSCWV